MQPWLSSTDFAGVLANAVYNFPWGLDSFEEDNASTVASFI